MTAKHVIDEAPSTGDDPFLTVDGILGILYLSPEPPDDGSGDLFGGFIPMSNAYSVGDVDIAVMHLNIPVHVVTGKSILFPAQPLRLDFPKEGEGLFALGYEKGEWTLDAQGIHSLSQTFTASKGFASTVHPSGRGAVFPTPCFQTSVPFRSGMSGGPVISADDGRVLGVVSTGFDLDEGEDPISYATPLAASMGIQIRGVDDAKSERIGFLWDFVEGGAVIVERGNSEVTRSDKELLVRIGGGQYRALLGA